MKNRGRLAEYATLLIGILPVVWLSAPMSMRVAAATTVTPSPQPTSSVSRVQLQLINDIVEANPNDLAGLGIDPVHARATVYVVASRQGLASTAVTMSAIVTEASKPAPDGAKTWTLAFAIATHSLAELRQARDAVTVREPWATASRPYLAQWYVDAMSNRVVLGVTEIRSTLTAAAQQTFGDMARVVVAARPGPADRNNDYPAWTAGDVIPGGCTSGFGAYDTVTLAHGELGAGHCFSAVGDPVQQGTGTPPATMGRVSYRVFGGGDIDFAFVDSTNTGSDSGVTVFTTMSSLTSVSSSLTSGGISGYPVCTSGSVTLENCAATVRLEDVCTTWTTGVQICHLDMAESTNGSAIVVAGDSGGPVYHKNPGGDVQAVGSISGCIFAPGATSCRTPSTQVWFTPIRFIPSRFHVMTTSSPIPPAPARVTIRSNTNGLFTSTEVSYGGGDYALLRARAASAGGWEQYTLVPQSDGTYAIQSNVNFLFVTAELGNPGSTYAELRARSNVVGGWEKFRLILQSGNTYAIQSDANGQYVAGEFGNPEPYYAMLRARSSAIGGWEQWTINSA